MATYVMSDLHGEYALYKKMLKKIKFSDEDVLYILGDVVDRGPNPIMIVLDIMERDNVIPLMGNHEQMALNCLSFMIQEITDETLSDFEDYMISNIMTWQMNGSASTLDEFQKLDSYNQLEVLQYMNDWPAYAQVEVNGQQYLMVHAGFGNFKKTRPIEDYGMQELLWERPTYKKPYFKDKIVILGHTPTRLIEGNENPDYIFKKNNFINLDCGTFFTGRMGCICLETGEEFYVEKTIRKPKKKKVDEEKKVMPEEGLSPDKLWLEMEAMAQKLSEMDD